MRLWLATLLVCTVLPAAALARTVQTQAGPVAGSDGVVEIFRGIPYAAAPVGDLRWRPPTAPADWAATRDATHFGPDCPHVPTKLPSGQPQSEDCLTLNIWEPASAGTMPLPVMVFIHGGSFVAGSGAIPLYDGRALAGHGVVVVTLNYRLGVLGFLAHPALSAESSRHMSGNYGLLDQIAALGWVKRNIRGFGGDPARVTVFGESAGATSVALLLASPEARGLFAGAILQSPALGWPFATLTAAEKSGLAVGTDLAAMRRLPVDQLLALTERVVPPGPPMAGHDPFPIVDGVVVPSQPQEAFAAGHVMPVPVIVGTNADEGRLFTTHMPAGTPAEYNGWLGAIYGRLAPQALSLYPAADAKGFRHEHAAVIGDLVFNDAARLIARGMTPVSPAVYRYVFTKRAGGGGRPPTHSAELGYVFGTLGQPTYTAMAPADSADRALSRRMMDYWTGFAVRGDPNGPGRAAWPRYDLSQEPSLVLDVPARTRVRNHDRADCLDLAQRLYLGR